MARHAKPSTAIGLARTTMLLDLPAFHSWPLTEYAETFNKAFAALRHGAAHPLLVAFFAFPVTEKRLLRVIPELFEGAVKEL